MQDKETLKRNETMTQFSCGGNPNEGDEEVEDEKDEEEEEEEANEEEEEVVEEEPEPSRVWLL